MLQDTLIAKAKKVDNLALAALKRQEANDILAEKAEKVRIGKIEGEVRKEQNSRFYKLQAELEAEHEAAGRRRLATLPC